MRSPLRLPRSLRRDLLFRTILIWCGMRAALTFLASASQLSPLATGISASAGLLVSVSLLFDIRVCRETLLLGNLGVSRAQILGVALGVSALAEGVVHLCAALV
jgi:hypothetical protein